MDIWWVIYTCIELPLVEDSSVVSRPSLFIVPDPHLEYPSESGRQYKTSLYHRTSAFAYGCSEVALL